MNIVDTTNYIFLEDTDLKGDGGLVFGTWEEWADSLETAAILYSDKLIPKIIFSNGVNPTTGVREYDPTPTCACAY